MRKPSNVRCSWRALQALRLIAYHDLLIIGGNAHIEPTARSWTGALARKQRIGWRRGAERRPPLQRPRSTRGARAPAHSRLGRRRSPRQLPRGPGVSTESLGRSPRDRSRLSRWVVAGPRRRIEAQFALSPRSRAASRGVDLLEAAR